MRQLKPQGAMVMLAMVAIAGCTTPSTPNPEAASPSAESGSNPESGVALPPDEAILQTVYDQAESLDLCDGFYQPEVAQADSRVYRVGDRALVELVCANAAYQAVYAYVAYQPDGSWQPLSLDVFYPDETGQFVRTSEGTVGGLATFDPEQGLLTVFSKARGIGDCGSLADYRWSGGELALETFRYQECSDSPEENFVDPADYPQVYP
ncbi:DUF1176 domain-containing protein [Leptolyngbya sp. CCNP1308]|uniref:DUF1176 domain-containing protein n=1 Tax=Leptolyngbya sp. CCNP1308 TaxID=3110255 RepID=UPI002B1FB1A9|nr:DUF1176 domain-containing protein [Leptolyngbya sp. CCNP1308]MEA5452140.1 DUF1176 domain-containing protein [Leptolyngbya sp. CCNP1308]